MWLRFDDGRTLIVHHGRGVAAEWPFSDGAGMTGMFIERHAKHAVTRYRSSSVGDNDAWFGVVRGATLTGQASPLRQLHPRVRGQH